MRRSTRDIAVAAEAKGDQHAIACVEHNSRVEKAIADGRADRERMHAENKAEICSMRAEAQADINRVENRIDSVDGKIHGLPFKIIGSVGAILAAVVTIAASIIGWLLTNGGFLHVPK